MAGGTANVTVAFVSPLPNPQAGYHWVIQIKMIRSDHVQGYDSGQLNVGSNGPNSRPPADISTSFTVPPAQPMGSSYKLIVQLYQDQNNGALTTTPADEKFVQLSVID